MAPYITKQDDMIDRICWLQFGTHDGGVVEAVLAVNPHIAFEGPKLPAGLTLELPTRPTRATTALTSLWE